MPKYGTAVLLLLALVAGLQVATLFQGQGALKLVRSVIERIEDLSSITTNVLCTGGVIRPVTTNQQQGESQDEWLERHNQDCIKTKAKSWG